MVGHFLLVMLNKSNFVVKRRRSASVYSTAEAVLILYVTTLTIKSVLYKDPADCAELLLSYCDEVTDDFLYTLVTKFCEPKDPKISGFLLAVLASRNVSMLKRCFNRCVRDSAVALTSFVLTIRSGVTGRKSLGSAPKRLVKQWLEGISDEALFNAATGEAPDLVDVIRLVHPKPSTPHREALFAYLLGSSRCDFTSLPACVLAHIDLD